MSHLARRHQSKQGPCRLRGGGGSPFETLIIESVADGILAPAAIRVLDRQQPVHGLAHRGVLMIDAGGVERAQYRPGTVDVVEAPAAIPGALRELGPAQIVDAIRD